MKKAVALILALSMMFALCGCGNNEAYENANACFFQGRYADAAKFYIEADNYKDSREKLLEIYYRAVTCFEEGEYKEAYEIFEVLAPLELNTSKAYDDILTEYFKWKTFQPSLIVRRISDKYRLPGVLELAASMQSICYDGTFLIKFENFISDSSTLEIESEDVTDVYTMVGKKSVTEYKYRQKNGYGKNITIFEEYIKYLTDNGAKIADDLGGPAIYWMNEGGLHIPRYKVMIYYDPDNVYHSNRNDILSIIVFSLED